MHPQQLGRFFDGATVLLGVAEVTGSFGPGS